MNKKIAIILGSETDRPAMESANIYYEYFGLDYEIFIISAHRNPKEVHAFASSARENGYGVLVGAAGMAAHLAGALKSVSTLPVIGVPLKGGIEGGMDSLLSTVQMPKGVPVATMSIGKHGAINAAILSAEILSLSDEGLVKKLANFKTQGAKL